MQYPEAIQFLDQLRMFGARLGLETMARLAALAGNPQAGLRFIHVAGTNGKGSTCAILESIYRASGLRVGLFTSPHLVSFRERIQVNRSWISEEEVVRRVQEVQSLLATESFPEESSPTFFEVVTLMALLHFREQECDLVIWETGLGGRLDATNIVTPLAGVITNVQLDHQKWLGQTERDIAKEKAGIIKHRIPAITSEENPEIVAVLAEAARRAEAPFLQVSRRQPLDPLLASIQLPLLGEHQRWNAALALAVVRTLMDKLPVSEEAIRQGLTQVSWPGRLQLVRMGPGRTLVLDGAHNPAGAHVLRAALTRYFPGTLATLVLGVMRDKDWPAMCQALIPLAGRICLAPVASERTVQPGAVRDLCRQINPYAEVQLFNSAADALQQTLQDPLVVVTGSLYFVGEAMEALRLCPVPAAGEKGLNDWQAPAKRGG
jgi:dihydrofolate synthase/folylpolyglutamate synthase